MRVCLYDLLHVPLHCLLTVAVRQQSTYHHDAALRLLTDATVVYVIYSLFRCSSAPIWAYTNVDEVELFIGGVSVGRKSAPKFGHVEWPAVTWAPGNLHALGYITGQTAPVIEAWRNTTGAPAALRLSIKDNVGANGLIAGCQDVALVVVSYVMQYTFQINTIHTSYPSRVSCILRTHTHSISSAITTTLHTCSCRLKSSTARAP